MKPIGTVPSTTRKANPQMKPNVSVPQVCDQLRELQRQRICNLKSRIMICNRLVATVATASGYNAGMEEKERLDRFKQASETIAAVLEGEYENHACAGIIQATGVAIDGFDRMVKGYEKAMVKLAKQLPSAAWVAEPAQRGFGILSLAIIVGECGDLDNYANPAKVWRRMGCAPYQSDGKTLMPATWRGGKEGKLSAEEWEDVGYSPRRRSIAFLIGEGLCKQNGGDRRDDTDTGAAANGNGGTDEPQGETEKAAVGPYRLRYDETKAKVQREHPDYPKLRCHRHGMLLATKLLLKNLWIDWTGEEPVETDFGNARQLTHA